MASRGEKKGLDQVAAMMAAAEVVPIAGAKAKRFGGDDGRADRRGAGGRRSYDEDEPELPMLPVGCPITPLGKRKQTYFFLDELGEFIELPADKVAQKGILSMFGRKAHLVREFWPRYAQGKVDPETGERTRGPVNGWKIDVATEILFAVAATKGVFDPMTRVRGRGAHVHEDGALILHCGDRVLIGPTPAGAAVKPENRRTEPLWHLPGEHGRFVYPTGATLPRPHDDEQDHTAGDTLNALFRCWQWKRAIDPVLLLGWIASAMIGGALEWRAHVWVTGDSATGKSTLQKAIEYLFAGEQLKSADATEAGIRQILGQDTLPVALDEAEAEENSAKINALVKLARIASSGDQGLRGGADHKGHSFDVKSSFLFSSVLLPAMLPQDRNRLAILELNPIPAGVRPPVIDRTAMRLLGSQVKRRLFDQWGRFEGVLADYRQLLAKNGHGGRTADQFGTLLACADLLLHDHDRAVDGEEATLQLSIMEMWAAALAPEKLVERADEMSNAERCADRLGSSLLPPSSGRAPESVRQWILHHFDQDMFKPARARLGSAGMRVVRAWIDRADGQDKVRHSDIDPGWTRRDLADEGNGLEHRQLFLAIASAHRGLDPLFKDTPWAGRAGASGGWGQALRRIDGAIAGERVRIDGKTQACTLVPLGVLADLGWDSAAPPEPEDAA